MCGSASKHHTCIWSWHGPAPQDCHSEPGKDAPCHISKHARLWRAQTQITMHYIRYIFDASLDNRVSSSESEPPGQVQMGRTQAPIAAAARGGFSNATMGTYRNQSISWRRCAGILRSRVRSGHPCAPAAAPAGAWSQCRYHEAGSRDPPLPPAPRTCQNSAAHFYMS